MGYLDMAEQEQFVEDLSLTIREDMVKRHPHFANILVMEHLVQLCADPEKIKDGVGLVTDDERKALTELFHSMDHDGSGSISIAELLQHVRGLYISTPDMASLITADKVGKLLQKLEPGAVDISLALFIKLMHSTVALADESHEAIAVNQIKGASIDSSGRATAKYLLSQSTKKYRKAIYTESGEVVPANERPNFDEDHWFELPLASMEALADTANGRLFTTRMPQGITPHWKDGTQVETGMTDPEVFRRKVRENGVTDVFVLVETQNPNEPEEANSGDLFDFYKSCGLQIHHRPIEDYSLPTVKAEEENINDITSCIVDGKGCLVHCWGGSGRTGTVVIGVLKQLGSQKPIRDARRVKSVYLDMAEQEQFVENLSLTIREDMVKRHPHFANVLVMEHLVQLCAEPDKIKDGVGLVTEDERMALTEIFHSMDHDGSGSISVAELLHTVRGLYISSPAMAALITESNLQKVLQKLQPGSEEISLALFIKLMHSTCALAAEDHEAIAINQIKGATIDSKGRATSKFLLSQSTKKYKKAIYAQKGEVVPANERSDFDQDHWFELPVASLDSLAGKAVGRLFSTRMPRGITPHWKDGTQVDKGMTHPEVFRRKVRDNGVTDIFVLVEADKDTDEPEEHKSGDLFDFYKSFGLEIHHRPIQDYSLPTVEAEKENINDIVACIVDGKGCLVHCLGGSGRTGTVVIGVLKELGCQKPILEARKVKSVYLDIAEQEQFVENLSLTMRADMVKRHPKFANILVVQHLADLCAHPENLKDGSGLISKDERQALTELFHRMDADGSGTLTPAEFTQNLQGIYGSSEDSASLFTVTGIQKLIRTMKPGAKEVDLELFMRIMHATCALDAESRSAISVNEIKG